ncbi:hypothetical protein ACM64Y_15080 [Novispirillum sp. DQ9]|uniref:hypothetical protein n=1 Tax=Novispirillum sp. DQ9 TaxID=3398612 RepID=UPI003C7D5EE8
MDDDIPCPADPLPAGAEAALKAASRAWHEPDTARRHLAAARQIAPQHRAVLIGHYKFHFYRTELAEAAPWALACVRQSLERLGLERDWRRLPEAAGQAPFAGRVLHWPAEARFLAYALKAYGYVRVRLGDLEDGCAALAAVAALDPEDACGAAGLLAVVARGPDADDDGEG